MSRRSLSIWRVLEEFPPYCVRLMAKRNLTKTTVVALSDEEIAIASVGLTLAKVREMSRSTDWMDFTLREIIAFTVGCNFDPTSARDRTKLYIYNNICRKRHSQPFQWVTKSPFYEAQLLPAMKLLKTPTILGGAHSAANPHSPPKRVSLSA